MRKSAKLTDAGLAKVPCSFLLLVVLITTMLLVTHWLTSSATSAAHSLSHVSAASTRSATDSDSATSNANSTQHDEAVEEVVWLAGGVTGPSQAELNDEWDAYVRQLTMNRVWRQRAAQVARYLSAASVTSAQTDSVLRMRRAAVGAIRQMIRTVIRDVERPNSKLASTEREDDCRLHLPAHHRAACVVLGFLDNAGDARERNSPDEEVSDAWRLRDNPAYRLSYCRPFLPCLQWSRGRFQMPISAQGLARIIKLRVEPKLAVLNRAQSQLRNLLIVDESRTVDAHALSLRLRSTWRHLEACRQLFRGLQENYAGFEVLAKHALADQFRGGAEDVFGPADCQQQLRSFIDDASPLHPSLKHLVQPSIIDGTFAAVASARPARVALPVAVIPEVSNGSRVKTCESGEHSAQLRRNTFYAAETFLLPHEDIGDRMNVLSGDASPLNSSTRFIDRSGRKTFIRGAQAADVLLQQWSSTEVLAILWFLCQQQSDEARATGQTTASRSSCVLLFHGDSLVREMFHRLVLHIRYGWGRSEASPPTEYSGAGSHRHSTPHAFATLPLHVEVGGMHDLVYRVFPSHDEWIALHSPASVSLRNKGNRAVNETVRETSHIGMWTLSAYLDALAEYAADSSPPSIPLLHLIFCWDHDSRRPRRVGFDAPPQSSSAVRVWRDERLAHRARHGTIALPLQVMGFTFWQPVLHQTLLDAMTSHATTTTRASGTSVASRTPSPQAARHLYVMTPLYHNALRPRFERLEPQMAVGVSTQDWSRDNGPLQPLTDGCLELIREKKSLQGTVDSNMDDSPQAETDDEDGDGENHRSSAAVNPRSRTRSTTHSTALNEADANPQQQQLQLQQRNRSTQPRRPQPRCPHGNVAKTYQLFRWLNITANERRRILSSPLGNTSACIMCRNGTSTPRSSSSPLLSSLWTSIALLDKGRLPFLGMPMGDHRHTSCHSLGTSASPKSLGFRSSLEWHAFAAVLSPAFAWAAGAENPTSASTQQRNATLGNSQIGGARGTEALQRITRPFASQWGLPQRQPDGNSRGFSVADLSRLMSVAIKGRPKAWFAFIPRPKCNSIGNVGCANVTTPPASAIGKDIFFSRRDGSSWISVAVSPPKETVSVVMNGDVRCFNSGDLALVQALLTDALSKKIGATHVEPETRSRNT